MPEEMCHSGTALPNFDTLIFTILYQTPVFFFRCGWFWCVLVLWVWVVLGFFGWGGKAGQGITFNPSFPLAPQNCFRGCSQTISFLVLVQPQILNARNHRDIGTANMEMTVES